MSRIFFSNHSLLSAVTTEVTSKVAFSNTNASFICAGYDHGEIHVDAIDKSYTVTWNQLPQYFPDKNIFINGQTNNIGGKIIDAFLVDILADNTTNGTEVTCRYFDSHGVEITGPATLTVAAGIYVKTLYMIELLYAYTIMFY